MLSDLFLGPVERSKVQEELNAWGSVGFIIGPTLAGHLVEWGGGFECLTMLTSVIFLINFGRLMPSCWVLVLVSAFMPGAVGSSLVVLVSAVVWMSNAKWIYTNLTISRKNMYVCALM